MKILWHSNSPLVMTGYGSQTALFAPRIAETHDVAISAFYGLEGAPIMWEGMPVFPGLGGEFGNQYIAGHAAAFFGGSEKDGLVLTLMDVLAMSESVYGGLNTACWTPVDHDPATPRQKQFFTETAAIPIAMSRYGEDRLGEFHPLYCPHGVDTQVFKPLDKASVRKEVGVNEDAFIVGMVAANKGWPSRKGFVEAIQAFGQFRKRHPDAMIYFHTEMSGSVSHGVPIGELCGRCDIPVEAIARADQYRLLFSPYPQDEMAAIYSSFDVLLNPSTGEGFGLPQMEAQACGTPVIATDFSAMKEVVAAGWKVGGQYEYTGQNSWQMRADVGDIVDALEHCYNMDHEQRNKLSKQARGHALNYDVDRVVKDFMLPVLDKIEERLEHRKEPPKVKLAQ